MAAIDIDAYFQRIGYAGERTPTLQTLRALHARHTEAIPFENLNPLLKWPVRLDPASLEEKLVRSRRGGYCFEQNLLLSHVLTALGFSVMGLGARVIWNQPEGAITARTHMLLQVDLDEGHFIADVGFGGQVLTGPLLIEAGVEQATPHEPFRLIRAGADFVLQVKVRGAWRQLYRFDLQQQHLPDYEVANWYLSNYPGSHFVTGLMAARTVPGRRYALRNNDLAVHDLNGNTTRRMLANPAELREALQDVFLLDLPDAPELDAALARMSALRP
jgi:N-hydroxyarylamine O-acetyltransferase